MFHVVLQKKFYALALIVALLTLKASLSTPSLQRLPSDLHPASASFSIIGTLAETSDGTPLRLGRERSQFLNLSSLILPLVTGRITAGPSRDAFVLLIFSAWLLAVGREQSATPQSDMVSRK